MKNDDRQYRGEEQGLKAFFVGIMIVIFLVIMLSLGSSDNEPEKSSILKAEQLQNIRDNRDIINSYTIENSGLTAKQLYNLKRYVERNMDKELTDLVYPGILKSTNSMYSIKDGKLVLIQKPKLIAEIKPVLDEEGIKRVNEQLEFLNKQTTNFKTLDTSITPTVKALLNRTKDLVEENKEYLESLKSTKPMYFSIHRKDMKLYTMLTNDKALLILSFVNAEDYIDNEAKILDLEISNYRVKFDDKDDAAIKTITQYKEFEPQLEIILKEFERFLLAEFQEKRRDSIEKMNNLNLGKIEIK
jgi:hypothetical protein